MLGSEQPVLSTHKKALTPQNKPEKALPLCVPSLQEIRGIESKDLKVNYKSKRSQLCSQSTWPLTN